MSLVPGETTRLKSSRLVVVLLLLSIYHGTAPADDSLTLLDPESREDADRYARRFPPKDTFDLITGRAIGEFARCLPAGRAEQLFEYAYLRDFHRQNPRLPVPAEIRQVLDDLTRAIPDSMRQQCVNVNLSVVRDETQHTRNWSGPGLCIPQSLLNRLLADREYGRDRIAFLLAHQLGHVYSRHAVAEYRFVSNHAGLGTDHAVNARRTFLRFATPVLDLEADQFALSLCRNAGIDVAPGIDDIRRLVLASARREGQVDRNGYISPAERLRHLLATLAGDADSPRYGFYELERVSGRLRRLSGSATTNHRGDIILIHGAQSDALSMLPLGRYLQQEASLDGRRILLLQYPNDAAISRSGRYLAQLIKRMNLRPRDADFICYSAGGLVFRWYAEVEEGMFHQSIFIGTPHHGTPLARVAGLLEIVDALSGQGSLDELTADGLGEITQDLQPGSLCLTYLNGMPKDTRSRYHSVRGLLPGTSETALPRRLPSPALDCDARWHQPLNCTPLSLPQLFASSLSGDLVVSATDGKLDDVATDTAFNLTHLQLLTAPSVRQRIADILSQTSKQVRSHESGNLSSR